MHSISFHSAINIYFHISALFTLTSSQTFTVFFISHSSSNMPFCVIQTFCFYEAFITLFCQTASCRKFNNFYSHVGATFYYFKVLTIVLTFYSFFLNLTCLLLQRFVLRIFFFLRKFDNLVHPIKFDRCICQYC